MSRPIAVLAFAVITIASHACEKVPLLAPTGSTVTLSMTAETRMPLNGTRQVTAIVIESSGTAPQNGTVVTFATDLGRFDPIEARTTNGLATSTFHSGNRSGTATIRAFSGGAGTGGESEATATILVGGAGVETVLLRTEASSSGGTSIVVVATVLDLDGNPVPGVAVAFSADRGQVSPGVVTADGIGEARATVATSEETVVTATAGSASGTIAISAPGTLTLALGQGDPPFEVGRPVNFTVTANNGAFFSNVVVDFGDGSALLNLGAVSAERNFTYTFTRRGNFIVTATATTATGTTTSSSLAVQVNDEAPLNVQLAASPSTTVSLATNTVTTYTVTLSTGIGTGAPVISRINWNFGDGSSRTTTSTSTSYRHTGTGTFVVTATAFSTDGRQGTAQLSIRVTP